MRNLIIVTLILGLIPTVSAAPVDFDNLQIASTTYGTVADEGNPRLMDAYNNKIYFIVSNDGSATPSKVCCYTPSDGWSNSVNHSIIEETTGKFVTLRQINNLLYFSDNLGNVYSYNGTSLMEMSGTPFTVSDYVSSIGEFDGLMYFGTSTSNVFRYDGSTYERVYEVTEDRSSIIDMVAWQQDGYFYVSVGPERVCCPPTGYVIRSNSGDDSSWGIVFQGFWSAQLFMPTADYLYTAVMDTAYSHSSTVRKSSDGTTFPIIYPSDGQYKRAWGSFYYDGIAYFFTGDRSGGLGERILDDNGSISRTINQNWVITQAVELNGEVYALASDSIDAGSIPADVYLITTAPEPAAVEMEWVTISEAGFTGHMSKYETTNAQYCQFLNDALASGDITVSGNNVYGVSGSNSGVDYVGEAYYDLANTGWTYNGATNGGAARITYSGSVFTVDSGFDNHPVTGVGWYGAMAFSDYYGYRLPTAEEWQAVADFDGSYTYGCGTSINNSMANYYGSAHPDGTTVVGSFGTYGYGLADMAGNVHEWIMWTTGNYDTRGGGWSRGSGYCIVSNWLGGVSPGAGNNSFGFRVASVAEPAIEALIDIDPDTLNKKSHGKWITVYITLPDGFDVGTIDTSSIAITSLIGETCDPHYTQEADLSLTPQVGDRDEDGILDLTVKFDRQVLLASLCLDDVSITIEGELTTGELFSGSDSIRIIDRGK